MWKLPIKAHSVFTIKIHAVCACVFFPSAGSFLHDLCTAVWLFQVRGKQIRRSDFSYLGHTPPPPSSPPPPPQPPYHQHHHHQPSPSHSLQTYRVTDLQRKPLFTLAVILQVIKTTWSSPTISPLNARCVMTSLLPLPHTHTDTQTHTYPLSRCRPRRYLEMYLYTSWASENYIKTFLKITFISTANYSWILVLLSLRITDVPKLISCESFKLLISSRFNVFWFFFRKCDPY